MDERLKATITAAKREYDPEGLILLGVFGSRARGDFVIGSDLDISIDWRSDSSNVIRVGPLTSA
jgi:predicted nucleotidyltransferase